MKKISIFGIPLFQVCDDGVNTRLYFMGLPIAKKRSTISYACKEEEQTEPECANFVSDMPSNHLTIGLQEGGGIGDSLFQLVYLKEFRKLFRCPLVLTFYSRGHQAFQNVPFLDACHPYVPKNSDHKLYDIWITSRRLWEIRIQNPAKVQEMCPEFYEFYLKNKNFLSTVWNDKFSDNLVSQYACLFRKTRFEQPNIHEYLPITRNTPKYLNWNETAFSVLSKFSLDQQPYITISRAVDAKYSNTHPKLWPLEHYNELVNKIKEEFPNIKVVQVGSSDAYGKIENIDVYAVARTTLDQAKVLLKYSALHIDSEGGLVHMRRCLYGKSIVMFGPTLPDIYGYDANINIRETDCPGACCQLSPLWTQRCLRGFEVAPCMEGLSVDKVYSHVREVLAAIPSYAYHAEVTVKSLADYIKGASKIAVLFRPREDDLVAFQDGDDVVVYDCDLSMPDKEYSRNPYYLTHIEKYGLSAEYATPYNIPAEDETYDLVYCYTLSSVTHVNYAVAECLRVLKKGGVFVVRCSHSELRDAGMLIDEEYEGKKFIAIRKTAIQ